MPSNLMGLTISCGKWHCLGWLDSIIYSTDKWLRWNTMETEPLYERQQWYRKSKTIRLYMNHILEWNVSSQISVQCCYLGLYAIICRKLHMDFLIVWMINKWTHFSRTFGKYTMELCQHQATINKRKHRSCITVCASHQWHTHGMHKTQPHTNWLCCTRHSRYLINMLSN